MDDPCIEEEKDSSRQTGLEWLDPDGKLCVDELLLQSLASLAEEIRKLLPTKGQQTKQIQPLRCPACPFRMFNQKDQLRTHMHRHHTRKQQFCCSGTKLQPPTLLQQLKRGMESESLRASSGHEDGRGPGPIPYIVDGCQQPEPSSTFYIPWPTANSSWAKGCRTAHVQFGPDLSTFKVPIFVFFVAVSFWFEPIQVM